MRPNSASESRPEVQRDHEHGPQRPRPPAAVEEIEQFRHWFDRHAQHEAQPADAARIAAPLDERERRAITGELPPEAAALLNTHRLVLDLPAATTAMPLQSAGLGDLIEKHLRRMLVSEGARHGDGREARVMLRLSDASLPGTDLMLTRGDAGWELRAEVASTAARDALHACAPDLVERFAAGGLGKLSIETVMRV